MGKSFSAGDVIRSFRWLGHREFTEVNALHPLYRRDDPAWNRGHQTYPVVAYIQNAGDLVRFVEHYANERMVCFGLNPRPRVFTNQYGRPRSARTNEIEVAQNLVLDFDPQGAVTRSWRDRTWKLLDHIDDYLTSEGLAQARAGRDRSRLPPPLRVPPNARR